MGIKPFVLKIPPVTKYEGMMTSLAPEEQGKKRTCTAGGKGIFLPFLCGGKVGKFSRSSAEDGPLQRKGRNFWPGR